ncbi:MAG TPA: hypothetical protein VL572_12350 [Pyrinomonadaceae bacterium]|nr:hypothetical protein [Pyrinomonadaceae bacterium]
MNAIKDGGKGKKTGRAHSLDNYAETIPDEGVAAVQDRSDTTSDAAGIEDK